jgi:hypothetical protein
LYLHTPLLPGVWSLVSELFFLLLAVKDLKRHLPFTSFLFLLPLHCTARFCIRFVRAWLPAAIARSSPAPAWSQAANSKSVCTKSQHFFLPALAVAGPLYPRARSRRDII